MKAIVCHNHGSAGDVLELQGIHKPKAKERGVLT
jgi:NADPH:quinone reductase-like Zn-dependent oxidoreductase